MGRVEGTAFRRVEGVPVLLKEFTPALKRLLPWLRAYMLEREGEWLKLPRGQGSWDGADVSLSSRSTRYNLLGSGRTALERARLATLRDFIAASVAEMLVSRPAG